MSCASQSLRSKPAPKTRCDKAAADVLDSLRSLGVVRLRRQRPIIAVCFFSSLRIFEDQHQVCPGIGLQERCPGDRIGQVLRGLHFIVEPGEDSKPDPELAIRQKFSGQNIWRRGTIGHDIDLDAARGISALSVSNGITEEVDAGEIRIWSVGNAAAAQVTGAPFVLLLTEITLRASPSGSLHLPATRQRRRSALD